MSTEQRFEAKYIPEPFSGCWLWVGAVSGSGYGQIGFGKRRKEYAHRVSWQLHRSKIPEGLHVLHRCDTKPCVNPDHLFLGTKSDNAFDMFAKGIVPRGERHHSAKLTNDQVIQIRRSAASQRTIAKQFGVCQKLISLIKNNKRRVCG